MSYLLCASASPKQLCKLAHLFALNSNLTPLGVPTYKCAAALYACNYYFFCREKASEALNSLRGGDCAPASSEAEAWRGRGVTNMAASIPSILGRKVLPAVAVAGGGTAAFLYDGGLVFHRAEEAKGSSSAACEGPPPAATATDTGIDRASNPFLAPKLREVNLRKRVSILVGCLLCAYVVHLCAH